MNQIKISAFLKELRKESDPGAACRTVKCFWKNSITLGDWYKYA